MSSLQEVSSLEIPRNWVGPCPLCEKSYSSKSTNDSGEGHPLFHQDKRRPYYRCSRCDLIFVPAPWHLDGEKEKTRYDEHNNDPQDKGYRDFLGRIIPVLEEELFPITQPGKALRGLDFGCGPGPVLAEMLSDRGHFMETYDPYYWDRKEVLKKGQYHFITSTEVWEHFSSPHSEIPRLLDMLKEGGVLAVMTNLMTEKVHFKSWYYINDFTHISFFSQKSFLWLAKQFNLLVKFSGKDMVLLIKNG